MRVLVTGAGGMVGSHLVEYLHTRGDVVLGTYYRPTINLSEIPAVISLMECDVRYSDRLRQIMTSHKPDQIYHLAAQSFPTVSWERPEETLDTNIKGTIAVFEAVKFIRAQIDSAYNPVVVVACSSAEYGQTLNEMGGHNEVFIDEESILKPLHPYGVSKAAQDLLSYQYYVNDGLRCIRARIFNSTGTRKINDVTSDFTKRAVEAEQKGTYSIKVGNLHTRRAIMDQRDLISALAMLAEKGLAGEAYNICSEKIYAMRDIVALIEKELGHAIETIPDSALIRAVDEKCIAGSVRKLKAATGWTQRISMEQTIKDMIAYWRGKLK